MALDIKDSDGNYVVKLTAAGAVSQANCRLSLLSEKSERLSRPSLDLYKDEDGDDCVRCYISALSCEFLADPDIVEALFCLEVHGIEIHICVC